MKVLLGIPTDRMQDVLISLVKTNDVEQPVIIEDINPDNKIGMPKYLIKVDCLYFEDNLNWINLRLI